jgi:hypothetical protein
MKPTQVSKTRFDAREGVTDARSAIDRNTFDEQNKGSRTRVAKCVWGQIRAGWLPILLKCGLIKTVTVSNS